MRASDFIYEARKLFELKKLGRAFNHLEDLVFFYGSKGVQEALTHLRELSTQSGAESIRMKWDGCVHADSVLITSNGDMPISQLVTHFDQYSEITVLASDLDNNEVDVMTRVLGVSESRGVKKWVELEFENSETIKLTEDHEVYTTNRGWVPAGELTTDDDVKSIR